MKINVRNIITLTGMAILFNAIHSSALLTPKFTIEPDSVVQVGQEVLLDASVTEDDRSLDNGIFEWDFGDGQTMFFVKPHFKSGICNVHFFKGAQGRDDTTYTIKLIVTNSDGKKDSVTRTVTVKGREPQKGFELLHAPFYNRIRQYVYVRIPLSVARRSGYRLMVTLKSISDPAMKPEILLDKNQPNQEERFLLDQKKLIRGDYELVAELADQNNRQGDNKRQSSDIIRERFTKPYDGVPHVGIDENNSIRINDKLFYSISTWFMRTDWFEHYRRVGCTNGPFNKGYYDAHTIATWTDFVKEVEKVKWHTIGEDRWWDMKAENMRNSNTKGMVKYINAAKTSPAMLSWCFDDEPNMGGWSGQVPPSVLSAWSYINHREDPHHPSLWNSYRYIYLPTYTYNQWHKEYNYLQSESEYGGKKHWIADILHGAIFVLEGYKSDMLHDSKNTNRGAMDVYAQSLDLSLEYNKNLIPCMAFVAPADVSPDQNYGTPTADQVRMNSWVNVVHNQKGICWYPYQGVVPPANFGAMAEVYDQITDLTEVILGPNAQFNVTTNAATKGKRVDLMVRESNDYLYLFAVRVTELDYMDNPVVEPQSIEAEFTINKSNPGMGNALVYEDNKRSCTYYTVSQPISNTEITIPNAPLIKGKVFIAGRVQTTYNQWKYGYDDGAGRITGQASGTIDYSTGKVSINFGQPLIAGDSGITAVYVPKRDQRTVKITGGKFKDNFNREENHIYKIPKGFVGTSFNMKTSVRPTYVYQNPMRGNRTVRVFGIQAKTLHLYTVSGQRIITVPMQGNTALLPSNIASGIYLFTVDNILHMKKVTIL